MHPVLVLQVALLALIFAAPALAIPTTPYDPFHDLAVFAPKPPELPICCLKPLTPLEPVKEEPFLSFEEWKTKRHMEKDAAAVPSRASSGGPTSESAAEASSHDASPSPIAGTQDVADHAHPPSELLSPLSTELDGWTVVGTYVGKKRARGAVFPPSDVDSRLLSLHPHYGNELSDLPVERVESRAKLEQSVPVEVSDAPATEHVMVESWMPTTNVTEVADRAEHTSSTGYTDDTNSSTTTDNTASSVPPPPPSIPTHIASSGKSIYGTIVNRLTALEANMTLYARYVEEQTGGI
ncbi:hypothetical protein EW146_g6810 [Bondarzewia mesenterica]|uniref:Uncharacterized protein n=1 Tax=Bondarzewia mesenterica TaxID=1095465 RepID=A0A4S4LT53_9AGAM|nr:hypothetical protein EW146_g6810 [Bondarzewia mesenterica]